MSLALAGVRAALTPKWVSDDLWKRAGQVPAFDLDFTRQTIVDRIAGITPTYTRPSSEKRLWNGSAFQTYAADVPGFELRNGIWEYVHEPAATNLALRSSEFNDAAWNSVAGQRSVTANVGDGPDGTLSADRVTADGTNNPHFISQSFTLTAQVYTFSVYAKADTNNFMQLRAFASFGNLAANFDLATGVVGTITGAGVTSSIQAIGGGWYRCSMIFTPTAATASLGIYLVSSATAASNQVNSLSTSVLLWGAQLETGPVATSPIVTTGSTETRNADVMSITGTPAADLIARLGSSYWAYVEGTAVSGVGGSAFISADDNTNNERWRVGHNSTSAGQCLVVDAGTVTANNVNSGGSWPLGAYRKAVGAFAQDNVRLALTGQSLIADTSATLPTVTQFKIGAAQAITAVPGLFIRRIALFPGISSDALLNAMVA